VQKRYAQPLFCESNEFPDTDAILARMLPTCYEEGIFNGPAREAPAFMSSALEAFLKNLLTRALQVCRSDGAQYVQTRAYKRRRRREEAAFERGEVRKNAAGLLPVDQEALERRQPLSLLDLRLCVDVGTHGLGRSGARAMMRFEAAGIDDEVMFGERGAEVDAPGAPRRESAAGKAVVVAPKPMTNGVLTNGVSHHEDEEDVDDDDDCGWPGGSANDRRELGDILADCLEV
jgi:transcriptional coactivator HFI1/ADA1